MPKNPLEAVHKKLGAFLVERAGTPMPSRYGEVRVEHEMVRKTVGVFDLCSAGKVAIRGRERVAFLQRIVAADVGNLSPENGCYSLLLSRDARIAAEMRVLAVGDDVLLLTPSLARGKIRGLFDRLLAATDATVTDESEARALMSVQGQEAARVVGAVLNAPAPILAPFATHSVETRDFGTVVLAGAARGGESGYDVIVPAAAAATLFERLVECARAARGGPAGLEALDAMRIESGIPVYGSDMDETTYPHDIGPLDRGMSLTKGCFLGREGLARLAESGAPARKLTGLLFEGSFPPVRGDRLFISGRAVGAVTSGAYSPLLQRPVALAMLQPEATERGTQLRTTDDETVVVGALPFWTGAHASPGSTV
jgi:aminomethyltransferase